MKTRIKLSLYILCFLASLSDGHLTWAENSIPAEFSNRELLSNAKWTDAAFVQAITSNWDRYTGTQDFDGEEVLREKEIKIYGVVFTVQARRFNSDGVFEFVFMNKDHFLRDFREQFVSYGVKTWGAPLKSIDDSWGGKGQGIDSCEIEWLLGNTHIKFGMFGAITDDRWFPGACYLRITKQGKHALLKDLIALKCEGQRRLFGFKDSTEIIPVSPFVVLVDLNDNTLRRRDRSTWGKITEASEDYFVAEWQEKDKTFKHRFTIDRKLGTYEWKMTPLEPNKNYGGVNWGNCVKTNLQMEPKF
jgi:hypothetical protein